MAFASFEPSETVDQTGRIPAWTPCSYDPVFFDCQECEIGWNPCKLRLDDSLRHWRAAQYSRHSGLLSVNEERDNEIEGKITHLLRSHGVSVNVGVLLGYIPRETLGGITATELENLLRRSPKFVESSPRMFKLKDVLWEECSDPSFGPLPISSGTQLESLIENSPTLGVPTQTRLFKEFAGLRLLASFETWQTARTALDQIVYDHLDVLLTKRGWSITSLHKYAVGPETVPNDDFLTDEDVSATSRLLSAVTASELLARMSPEEASSKAHELQEILLRGNLRLVARVARVRAHGGFLSFADLVQIGVIGLMTAMERFDPFRGFQFSTYATPWIRQVISRDQANLDRSIRLPVHVVEEINALFKQQAELEEELERVPTVEELAFEFDIDQQRVEFLLHLASPIQSLEGLIATNQKALERELQLKNEVCSDEEYSSYRDIVTEAVEEVLSTLTERESRVIRMRFGIGSGVSQTLEQVGQEFGVTRERIRQIEAKALRKMRHPSRSRKLMDFY